MMSPSSVFVSEDTAIPVSLDGQRLILANGTLVLRSVKAEDSGYYTCTATNTLGFDTIIVNLLVQGRKMAVMAEEFKYQIQYVPSNSIQSARRKTVSFLH